MNSEAIVGRQNHNAGNTSSIDLHAQDTIMEASTGAAVPTTPAKKSNDKDLWLRLASRAELISFINELQQENKELQTQVSKLQFQLTAPKFPDHLLQPQRASRTQAPPASPSATKRHAPSVTAAAPPSQERASVASSRSSSSTAATAAAATAATITAIDDVAAILNSKRSPHAFTPVRGSLADMSSAPNSHRSSCSSSPSIRSETPLVLDNTEGAMVASSLQRSSSARASPITTSLRKAGSTDALTMAAESSLRRRESSRRVRSGSLSRSAMRKKAAQQAVVEVSQELMDKVQKSIGKRFEDPKYDKAARVIQGYWRQYTLNRKFKQMKRKAMRKSIAKRIKKMEETAPKKPSIDLEQRREQLMLLQAAKAFVGDDAAGFRNTTYPWMSPQPESFSSEQLTRLCRLGVYQFNRNVRKGMQWLFENNVVDENPADVAQFLRKERSLNRRRIGEYLGGADTFHLDVLTEYVACFDFTGLPFDKALRNFLGSFHVPGEAQKIERILQAFSEQYHQCNPTVFSHEDTPFILAFSIVMLNTDLHNSANTRKMTKDAFIRNNRGIDDGNDLPRSLLEEIYDRIEEHELKTETDNVTMIEKIVGQMNGKNFMDLAAPHRQFVSKCNVTTVDGYHRAKSKQVAKSRVLFLFNDLVVVTKQHKNKYTPKRVVPLYGLDVVYTNSPHFEGGLHLVNRREGDAVVLSFRIDNIERSTMAKNFENDLREMIWQTGAAEVSRLHRPNLSGPGPVGQLASSADHLSVTGSSAGRDSICSAESGDQLSVVSADSSSAKGRRFSLRFRKKMQKADVRRAMDMLDENEAEC